MHPWDHARSSAHRFGSAPDVYYPFHAWLDQTKSVRAHFTHRALRHHQEGIVAAARLFGSTIRLDDERTVDLIKVGLQHLAEDLGCAPSARDWLAHTAPMRLPAVIPSAEDLARRSAVRFGGKPETFLPPHGWFLSTEQWFNDERHLLMRHHSWGIFEAEDMFGATVPIGGARSIPVRIVAEQHVRTIMGRIPDSGEVLHCITPQRWMAGPTRPGRRQHGPNEKEAAT